jgi:hypothetical protein
MSRKANHKTDRQTIAQFQQIINIGPATSDDLVRMGMETPQALIGQDPVKLYRQICTMDKKFYDPCVLDVFMATVDYMNGNRPQTWWSYTPERKKRYARDVEALRGEFER